MVAIAGERLERARVKELRPTQITVGMHEVRRKREDLREAHRKLGKKFIERHMIPAVLGPNNRLYIVDHHHLARALHDEDIIDEVLVVVLAKLHQLKKPHFWAFLDNHAWVHPYDADGRRCDYENIPKSVAELKDDPYRSLAGELRRTGGYAKDATPYTEFLWADAMRERIGRKLIEKDFDRAIERALRFAKSADADYLPGWCGASSN